MLKHICPICDKAMPTDHFCPNCRQWIKNPWTRDVNYYLNERHQDDEKDCAYHDQKYFDRAMSTITPKPVQKLQKQVQASIQPKTVNQETEERPKGRFSGFGVVVLALILINVVLPLITGLIRAFSNWFRYGF